MNSPTEHNGANGDQPVAPAEAVASPAPAVPQAPSPPPFDARRRLRELLSIPESQRTDPQWDEIIELEVQLAPGNRIGHEGQPGGGGGGGGKRHGGPHGGPNPGANKGPGGGGNNFKRHQGRKFPKKKPAPGA